MGTYAVYHKQPDIEHHHITEDEELASKFRKFIDGTMHLYSPLQGASHHPTGPKRLLFFSPS